MWWYGVSAEPATGGGCDERRVKMSVGTVLVQNQLSASTVSVHNSTLSARQRSFSTALVHWIRTAD